MLLFQLRIRFIDGLDEIGEAWGLVDGPETREAVTQHLEFALGQKTDCDDPFLGQSTSETNPHQFQRMNGRTVPGFSREGPIDRRSVA